MDCVHTLYRIQPPQSAPTKRVKRHYRLLIITYCIITTHKSRQTPYYFRRISPIFRNTVRLRRGN